MFPPPTMDRPPNNASAENLCTRGCVAPRIETVSSSISSLDRHGESPACSHLWAGRSHRAPEGERQSQVLSRVWGMSADYLSPKKNKKCLVYTSAFSLTHPLQLICIRMCLHWVIQDNTRPPLLPSSASSLLSTQIRGAEIEIASSKRVCSRPDGYQAFSHALVDEEKKQKNKGPTHQRYSRHFLICSLQTYASANVEPKASVLQKCLNLGSFS